jgi:uncharacterized protein (TIGR00730 family)
MKKITVFCGSSMGDQANFETMATGLGTLLAKHHMGLVYGGAKVGLMGAVANGCLAAGGQVVGVLPRFLGSKEIAHDGLTELIWVDSMHERKTRMFELCDGFIALPGGFGTLEELFEILTWAQLGLHQKPIGLLNIDGYYDHLIAMIANMVHQGFLKQINQDMLLVGNTAQDLLLQMEHYTAPLVGKWINEENV